MISKEKINNSSAEKPANLCDTCVTTCTMKVNGVDEFMKECTYYGTEKKKHDTSGKALFEKLNRINDI
jgi:hypothetical protein